MPCIHADQIFNSIVLNPGMIMLQIPLRLVAEEQESNVVKFHEDPTFPILWWRRGVASWLLGPSTFCVVED